MVMMKIDRPELKPIPRPLPLPLPTPVTGNLVDDATFDLLDGDGNGRIGADEWKRAGWTADRQKAFDADGNGEVSRTEFRDGRRFEREFNTKDRNGDGKLDRNEFFGRLIGPIITHPWICKMPVLKTALGGAAKAADSLGAMIATPSRHLLPLKDRFQTFDGDGDGAVTKSEYLAGRRKESQPLNPWPILRDPSHKEPILKDDGFQPRKRPLSEDVLANIRAEQD